LSDNLTKKRHQISAKKRLFESVGLPFRVSLLISGILINFEVDSDLLTVVSGPVQSKWVGNLTCYGHTFLFFIRTALLKGKLHKRGNSFGPLNFVSPQLKRRGELEQWVCATFGIAWRGFVPQTRHLSNISCN